MKRIFVFTILFIITTALFSQSDPMQEVINYFTQGKTLSEKGDYQNALPLFKKALNIYTTNFSNEDETAGILYNWVGLVYYNMGEYEKALEYYFKSLTIYEKTLGKEHPNTASSYNNIGSLYYTKGDYVNAVSYLNKAVTTYEKIRFSNIPDANKVEFFASILFSYQ